MRWVTWTWCVVAACGDNVKPAIDAPAYVEASPAEFPQVVKLGGDVLATPKIVPIFFAGDDPTARSKIEAFGGMLGGSTYWSAVASEYGVGAITLEPTIVTSDAVPTTGSQLETWLAGHFDGNNGWPAAPDPQAIYTVFLPQGAVFTSGGNGTACRDFGGYHFEVPVPQGPPILYALLGRCLGNTTMSTYDVLTGNASHEWIEAATDPRIAYAGSNGAPVVDQPAFADLDPDHEIWAIAAGDEVGDMCMNVGNARQRLVGSFMAQRIWSNAAAKAGHDPCVPADAQPYLGVAPVLAEPLAFGDPITQTNVTTMAVQVPLGQSKTIDVDLFSDQPTDAWTVDVKEVFFTSPHFVELQFQWPNGTTGGNGDKLPLTITRMRDGDSGGSAFVVTSLRGTVAVAEWYGFVAN